MAGGLDHFVGKNKSKIGKKILLVVWKDACSEDAWTPELDIEPANSTIISVGMLIKETREVLTLGLNFDQTSENWSCIIHIPKSCISEKREISR